MRKNKKFIILSCFLLFITTSLITATVKAQEKRSGKLDAYYLIQLEKEYRKELKEVLRKEGYSNAGITMTKIVNKNMINYEVQINHRRLRTMDIDKKNSLQKNIRNIKMEEIEANYNHQFL